VTDRPSSSKRHGFPRSFYIPYFFPFTWSVYVSQTGQGLLLFLLHGSLVSGADIITRNDAELISIITESGSNTSPPPNSKGVNFGYQMKANLLTKISWLEKIPPTCNLTQIAVQVNPRDDI
jgi:hypothetical protein